ncbi:MAG: hypothetical protein A2579_07860 [Lysobacterales bacterium RIFOXYD1_FULL_69_11]|nr:MAG: hypothetical protein A2190_12585 [Xanthomonadales bacterium RIFOXYA1_FULL_69_10]OHE87182.1 MAG: hypothetical protein A2579_07860 [Xanthomonadales bacterium RIFOXYD1_FULL_69_11]
MTDTTPRDTSMESDSLRWSLRALRRDVAPPPATWDSIAARIAATPQQPVSRPRRWAVPVALAASLAGALAIGTAWNVVQPSGERSTDAAATPVALAATGDVQRQAQGMVREYQAALAEVGRVPVSPALQPGLAELDRNAAQILAALQQDPDSALLLQQLRRTYSRRLALSQRAALT